MWRWFNYHASRCPADKVLLRLNLDETSVCLWNGDDSGNVLVRRRRGADDVRQDVRRGATRTNFTHVAIICDDPEMQPLMPQVFIGNSHTLKSGEMNTLRAMAPTNVWIIRAASAWNNGHILNWIFSLIADALRPHASRFFPVMLLDCARQHTMDCISKAASRNALPLIFIHPRLTWMLQPLDAYSFLPYKRNLRRLTQRCRVDTADGTLDVQALWRAFVANVREILQGRRWAFAFDRLGFSSGQSHVSAFILRQLQWSEVPHVGSAMPAPQDLEAFFPRNMRMEHRFLFPAPEPRHFGNRRLPWRRAIAAPPLMPHPAASVHMASSVVMTRSRRRLAEAAMVESEAQPESQASHCDAEHGSGDDALGSLGDDIGTVAPCPDGHGDAYAPAVAVRPAFARATTLFRRRPCDGSQHDDDADSVQVGDSVSGALVDPADPGVVRWRLPRPVQRASAAQPGLSKKYHCSSVRCLM